MRAAASSWNLQSSQVVISSKINSSTAQWVSNNGHSGVWVLWHSHFLSTSTQKNGEDLQITFLLMKLSSTKLFKMVMNDDEKILNEIWYYS